MFSLAPLELRSHGFKSHLGHRNSSTFCIALWGYRPCDDMALYLQNPITCFNEDLESLYGREDKSSVWAVALRNKTYFL